MVAQQLPKLQVWVRIPVAALLQDNGTPIVLFFSRKNYPFVTTFLLWCTYALIIEGVVMVIINSARLKRVRPLIWVLLVVFVVACLPAEEPDAVQIVQQSTASPGLSDTVSTPVVLPTWPAEPTSAVPSEGPTSEAPTVPTAVPATAEPTSPPVEPTAPPTEAPTTQPQPTATAIVIQPTATWVAPTPTWQPSPTPWPTANPQQQSSGVWQTPTPAPTGPWYTPTPVPTIRPINTPTTAPTSISQPTAEPTSGTAWTATGVSRQSGDTHVLRYGETLLEVAIAYGVTLTELTQLNNISNASKVTSGIVLKLPGRSAATPEVIAQAAAPATPPPTLAAPVVPPNGVAARIRTSSMSLPGADNNVYWLSDGSLLRWNSNNSQVEVLISAEIISSGLGAVPLGGIFASPGPLVYGTQVVTDFRVSTDETKILIERGFETADGAFYDLALFDVASESITVLDENAPDLLDIMLTPDGSWAVYIRPDLPTAATVIAVNTRNVSQKVIVGSCRSAESNNIMRGCKGLAKGPHSSSVLFTDGRGIWQGGFDNSAAQPLVTYESFAKSVSIEPATWSPDGKQLLVWNRLAQGATRLLYDSERNDVIEVPGAEALVFEPQVSWLPDNRLLILQPSDPFNDRYPHAMVLSSALSDILELIVDDESDLETVDAYDASTSDFTGFGVFAPERLLGDGFRAAMLSADSREQGLYTFDIDDWEMEKLADWPQLASDYRLDDVQWSPDGRSLLAMFVADEDVRVFYVSAESDPVELAFEGDAVCCVQWAK